MNLNRLWRYDIEMSSSSTELSCIIMFWHCHCKKADLQLTGNIQHKSWLRKHSAFSWSYLMVTGISTTNASRRFATKAVTLWWTQDETLCAKYLAVICLSHFFIPCSVLLGYQLGKERLTPKNKNIARLILKLLGSSGVSMWVWAVKVCRPGSKFSWDDHIVVVAT